MTSKKGGITSHERPNEGASNDWLTPKWITDDLGPFDIDPCASQNRTWDIAKINISPPADGLKVPWKGAVWLNPPYGRVTWTWLERLANYRDKGKAQGIALVFARTETKGYVSSVWNKADAILFIEGRLKFKEATKGVNGNAGSPSTLVAYGDEMVERLRGSIVSGYLVTDWDRTLGGQAIDWEQDQ